MMKIIFILFPALVAGHGLMKSPIARTGDQGGAGLQSPKLSPWLGYKLKIAECGGDAASTALGLTATNAIKNARGLSPQVPKVQAGTAFNVQWDIRLGHADSKNHFRIAYRTYTGSNPGTTTSTFLNGILAEKEDTDANRAANQSPTYTEFLTPGIHTQAVTIPANTPAGMGEIQFIWASERDGAGGFYITCADIEILSNTDTTTTPAPTVALTAAPTATRTNAPSSATGTPAPTPGATQDQGNFWCNEGNTKVQQSIKCRGGTSNNPYRCMTTWVKGGGYFYRCADQSFCTNSIAGKVNEESDNEKTEIACCQSMNCNTEQIVASLVIQHQNSGASRLNVAFGFLLVSLVLLF